jgi:hypothetical protein
MEQRAYTHLAKQLGSVYVEKKNKIGSGFIKKGLISLHREMEKDPMCKIAMVRQILL